MQKMYNSLPTVIIIINYNYNYTNIDVKTCLVSADCELDISHTTSGSGN